MDSSSSTPDSERLSLLEELIEDFARRYREGERPAIKEYTDRCPHLADEIRELIRTRLVILKAEEEWDKAGESVHPKLADFARDIAIPSYRIIREIGRGGMGTVYEAEQIALGRRVALKVLPRHTADRTAEARFGREACAVQDIHHTNIVPVFDVGSEPDVCFYAMQLIRGLRWTKSSMKFGVFETAGVYPLTIRLAGGFRSDVPHRAVRNLRCQF